MNKITDKPLFWILLLGLLLLPFLLLSFYCHPSADDYIFAAQVRKLGIPAYSDLIYHTWSGRYFSTFIKFYTPLIYGWLWGYKLIPLFLIIFFYTSIYYFFKIIFVCALSKIKKHLLSLAFVLLYFNNMPSTSEGIYWVDGSVNYLFANTLLILFFSLLLKNWNTSILKIKHYIILAILPIMIVGSNEVSMLLLDEILILIIVYQFLIHKKINKLILIPFIISLISTIIETTAPGNYVKMTMSFPLNSDILLSLKLCVISFSKISVKYIQDPGFIIASMIYIAFLPVFYSEKLFNKMITISPLFSIPISLLILISLYFPVTFSTGINPALRIHDAVGLCFLFAWFYNLTITHNYFLKKGKIEMITVPTFLVKLLGIAAIVLIVSDFNKEPGKDISPGGNIFRAGYDLIFNARTYNSELNKREALIQESVAKNIKYLEVPALTKIPTTIHFIDISDKTYDWINVSTAEYFGLDSIKISKP